MGKFNSRNKERASNSNLREAKTYGKKSPVHIVSTWARNNNLVLGQVRVNMKSNEITAIPKLLETLVVEGCIITIDAMGTIAQIELIMLRILKNIFVHIGA